MADDANEKGLQPQETLTERDKAPSSDTETGPQTTGMDDVAINQKSKKEIWSYRIALMLGLFIPVFLETIDYTVVATAQPHIASAFNRLDLQSWIGTAYLLTSTVFLPLFASFADIFGRHAALQSSLFLFLIGSALSTGAKNMPMMLAGRGIAGIGAAGFLTLTRVILADSASLDENTFRVSGLIILYSIGYSAGPWIGGALTNINFRWVFGINLPAAAVGMVIIFLLLRKHLKGRQPSVRRRKRILPEEGASSRKDRYLHRILAIDFMGGFLFIAGSILILLGLNWGSTTSSDLSDQLGGHSTGGWSAPRTIASLVVGGLLVILSIVWELLIERYDHEDKAAPTILLDCEPILPIPVLKDWDTIICNYVSLTSGMVMLVFFYFVAIFFTIVSGQDPKQAGGQLVYFAPGTGVGVYLSLIMIKVTRQPRWPIILGSFVLPISLGLVSMAIRNNSQAQVDGFMAMAGAGVGLSFGPAGVHARFSQPKERVAVVEGLQLFFRTLGGTVGLAQCATVMNSKVTSGIANLIQTGVLSISDFPNANSSQSSSASGIASIQQITSLPGPAVEAIRNVYRNGVRWAFLSLIPWVAIAAIMSIFLSKITDPDAELKRQRKEQQEREKEVKQREAKVRREQLGEQEALEDEYAALGPKPKYNWLGIYGLVKWLIALRRWNRRKAEIDSRRAAVGGTLPDAQQSTISKPDEEEAN